MKVKEDCVDKTIMEELKPLVGQNVSATIPRDIFPYTGILQSRENKYVLTNAIERAFFGFRQTRIGKEIELPKGTKISDSEGNIYTL